MKNLINTACLHRLLVLFFSLLAVHRVSAAPSPDLATYNVRIKFSVTNSTQAEKPATVVILDSENRRLRLAFTVKKGRLAISEKKGKAETEIWSKKPGLPPGEHLLLLKQRTHGLCIYVDGKFAVRVKPIFHGKVTVKTESSPTVKFTGKPHIQYTAPIYFTDDFSQVGTNDDLWETLSGRFVPESSHNPNSSQGAFQLWGNSPRGKGLTIASGSYWFWDDYRAGISVKATEYPAIWGLGFYYEDAKNYHLLRYSKTEGKEGVIELVSLRDGRERVLAVKPLNLRLNQWYRATVIVYGKMLKAFVNGNQVLTAQDADMTGGQAGLYLDHSNSVYFDDLLVKSVNEAVLKPGWRLPSPFGPCEQQWSDYSGKHFLWDRYMVQWSRSSSFWSQGAGLQWFRTRFFNDVDFHWQNNPYGRCYWPGKPMEIVIFGEQAVPGSGYRFAIDRGHVTLFKSGKKLAEGPLKIEKMKSIDISVDQGVISAHINGKKALSFTDSTPIDRGMVAADIGQIGARHYSQKTWLDFVSITSSHRLDYSFAHAPASWKPQNGQWEGSHRWACVPKWSFFGGRGKPGAPGVDHGNATLWNLRRFKGDFDLELFLAPMEGTAQRVHFSYPVTLNVAFCADGRQLDSGYMLYFGNYDVPTLLYKGDKLLSESRARVEADLRLDRYPWYHRMTQVWQHLRIQKRKNKIIVEFGDYNKTAKYLGLKRIFEIEDPKPLTEGQFAIWTYGDNGVAIARVTVSYENSPGIESAHDETANPGKTQKGITRVSNPASGGSFCHDLTDRPVDLSRNGTVEFDFRPNPKLHLSLLASVRGHVAEWVLCGPERYRQFTISLGGSKAVKLGAWNHIRVDLCQALREKFPKGKLVADRVCIASPYETLEETVGIGVNREGSGYDLRKVKWSKSSPGPVPVKHAPSKPGTIPVLDDFEKDIGSWQRLGGWDGAALYRDPENPAKGHYSLRLLNQKISGPAGAWITRDPYNLLAFPKVSFDYRIPRGIEVNLILKANGHWFEVVMTGTDFTWPVIGKIADIKPDAQWHSAEFDLYQALKKQLKTDKITVQSLAIADTYRMTSWQNRAYWIDNFRLVPAVGARTTTRPKIAAPVGQQPKKAALAAPFISYIPSDRLCLQQFEWQEDPEFPEKHFGGFCIRREAWVLKDKTDGATGKGSIQFVNLAGDGFYSGYFRKSPWNPIRWPRIAFDYKFEQSGCALNLSLLVNGAMTIIEWTAHNNYSSYFTPGMIGVAEKAVQDRKWHHVDIDLLGMLKKKRFPTPEKLGNISATELSTWATNHNGVGYVNPSGAILKIDNFTIYSDRGTSPAFEWKSPGNPKGYSYVFDQKPNTVPATKTNSTSTRARFKDVKPGIWYFHVRACDESGHWGPAGNCRITVRSN